MRAVVAIAVLAATIAIVGCERDFSSLPGARDLVFSSDTLSFDTIYSGIVPPTAKLTLRNVGDADVTIGRIRLEGGDASCFGVNIGGRPLSNVSDVRLAHGDSLYIFASVRRPEPRGGRTLTKLTDRIVVESGANVWEAVLDASVLNVCRVGGVVESDAEWLCDSVPYLLSDTLRVASSARLVVGPGVEVLMSRAGAVEVLGSLVVAGAPDRRVMFRPMRQDGFYEGIPGQWGGVLVRGGGSASLNYADVACPTSGVVADSASSVTADGLWVRDALRSAVCSRCADVSLSNALLTNSGAATLDVAGGSVRLLHVTIANYHVWDVRRAAAMRIVRADSLAAMRADVMNTIIMGFLSAEVVVDSLPLSDVLFRNCLIKGDKKKVEAEEAVFPNCRVASDARFADRAADNYRLTPRSEAVGLADASLAEAAPTDFEGVLRLGVDTIQAGAFQTLVQRNK